jgi:hypothetical protein
LKFSGPVGLVSQKTMTPHDELMAVMNVQYETGVCAGAMEFAMALIKRFKHDLAVQKWAAVQIETTGQRLEQAQAFLNVLE